MLDLLKWNRGPDIMVHLHSQDHCQLENRAAFCSVNPFGNHRRLRQYCVIWSQRLTERFEDCIRCRQKLMENSENLSESWKIKLSRMAACCENWLEGAGLLFFHPMNEVHRFVYIPSPFSNLEVIVWGLILPWNSLRCCLAAFISERSENNVLFSYSVSRADFMHSPSS